MVESIAAVDQLGLDGVGISGVFQAFSERSIGGVVNIDADGIAEADEGNTVNDPGIGLLIGFQFFLNGVVSFIAVAGRKNVLCLICINGHFSKIKGSVQDALLIVGTDHANAEHRHKKTK
ncbi:MAG: hypothetical protein II916_05545 [Oscillospiraceae bacterium]|nr:hypothetical protein [Oscillospiraceae bacterium]